MRHAACTMQIQLSWVNLTVLYLIWTYFHPWNIHFICEKVYCIFIQSYQTLLRFSLFLYIEFSAKHYENWWLRVICVASCFPSIDKSPDSAPSRLNYEKVDEMSQFCHQMTPEWYHSRIFFYAHLHKFIVIIFYELVQTWYEIITKKVWFINGAPTTASLIVYYANMTGTNHKMKVLFTYF